MESERNAQELINEAILNNAKILHLNNLGLGLARIPDSLELLVDLKTLSLNNNELNFLPNSLQKLKNLQCIDVSGNNLYNLPDWIGSLNNLKEIILSDNLLTSLPKSLISLKFLKLLHINNNAFNDLPEWFGELQQLENLDISENKITIWPDSMGKLKNLKFMVLTGNDLKKLPEWIGNVKKLRKLILTRNNLNNLPESLRQLKYLRLLYIDDNQITTIPNWIGELTQLREFIISDNELTDLPESFSELRNLETLIMHSNKFKSLPESIRSLSQLKNLNLFSNKLESIPEWIGDLISLEDFAFGNNPIVSVPDSLGLCTKLEFLDMGDHAGGCPLIKVPECVRNLHKLKVFIAHSCKLKSLPDWISELSNLIEISVRENEIENLPSSLTDLKYLKNLVVEANPLNPEITAAYEQGLDALMTYLRAIARQRVILNEAKLILIGEGEVGKSCLLSALCGEPWEEGKPTTHGIEIKSINLVDPRSGIEIKLNGWDFGGQRVYRPTHQLFFSAPAVYLVVWKPREGPQQGFVKEWIRLVKHREAEAKIIVVATHGGPGGRQPDIDRQELYDLFGKDTIIDFFFVDSRPDLNGERKGIDQLKETIARISANLPEVGRSVPKSFQDFREALNKTNAPYLPVQDVLDICEDLNLDVEVSRLFITISHRLGHLIYYENDPLLRDIVVLKPDWLATAISFVLDDENTRIAHGLVKFDRLRQLWNDHLRPIEHRYPENLHSIFLRLMERFDISYRVSVLNFKNDSFETSLIAQLVPDNRPEEELTKEWSSLPAVGDNQQIQICRIVDSHNNQSATAEGLFYQLIVRLHKYSLGRSRHEKSIHWQRGLILDDEYNGRALLEHIGNDVRITVRAPYPERFLSVLTSEVKYLVDNFWTGLRCDVMVPCIEPCGRNLPGTGLFEVEKLIQSRRRRRVDYPCPVCNEWQNIDSLLRNATAARPILLDELIMNRQMLQEIRDLRSVLILHHEDTIGRFNSLDVGQREILSKADAAYTGLMQAFTDEAKEGPRLFSLIPVIRANFNPKEWVSTKFKLTLWCEHSRVPLPILNGNDNKKGIYEIEMTREWFKKASPFLKLLNGTLSFVLPIAISGLKLALDEASYKVIEEQLDFSKNVIDASLEGSDKVISWSYTNDLSSLEYGEAIRAQGAILRELHSVLKTKDPTFGGLIRVQNKRQEFIWVHEQFAGDTNIF